MATKSTTIRADEEWFKRLDAWISRQHVKPTRTEVIKVAVEQFLEGNKMTKWREDNTEGFSKSELEVLNRVQDRIEAEYPEIDGRNISDVINNAWIEGMDEYSLYRASATTFRTAAE